MVTDNELNTLVAERVMGLRIDPPYCNCVGCQKGINVRANEIPDCANDIAAAWQVALKVASLPGYSVTIHVGDEVWIERAVETGDGNSHLVTWQDVARVGTAEGDARAICLAALDAVGAEVE